MSNIYFKSIINEIPRLLGLLDKNPISPTYGCFDRNFWHYNVTDFPCARFQEATLTLTYLYLIDWQDNQYYNSEQILNWINAGIDFWCSIQRYNGSFDEWYPYESSFVATAFTTYAISEVLLLMGERIRNYNKVLNSLERSVNFLSRNVDYTACNQEAGCILGIFNFYLLTSEEKYKRIVERRLKNLSKLQTEEGWFPEYGGPDIGYLSLTVDYLSKLYIKSDSPLVKDMLDRAVDFLSYFVHPDGTFGGEYGSRNTKYIIPAGIELVSHWNNSAKYIRDMLRKSLREYKTIGPYNLDDRYLAYIGYTYLQASLVYKDDSEETITRKGDRFFPKSSIWIYSDENFYLVSNLKKGAVLRIVFKNKESLKDSGVVLKIGKDYYTAGWLNSQEEVYFERNNVRVERKAVKIPSYRMTILKNILLRIFQINFGRFENINRLIKKILRRMLISKQKLTSIRVERYIKLLNNKIEIEDIIEASKNIDRVYVGMENPYVFIPSSRYFQEADLNRYFHEIIINAKRVIIRRIFDEEGKEEFSYKLY